MQLDFASSLCETECRLHHRGTFIANDIPLNNPFSFQYRCDCPSKDVVLHPAVKKRSVRYLKVAATTDCSSEREKSKKVIILFAIIYT